MPPRKRLGEILQEEGLITEEQLSLALTRQRETNERLGKILINMGYVSETTVLRILRVKLDVPIVNIKKRHLDPEIVKIIPEQLAKKYKIIPIGRNNSTIMLAMADPLNVFAVDDVRILTGCDVETAIASESEIDDAITKYYSMESIRRLVGELPETIGLNLDEAGLEQLQEIVSDAPVVKLVNSLMTQAVINRASDIHVEPREKGLRIRYRIDGTLLDINHFHKRMQAPVISRLKIMANMDIAERRLPQDGRIQMMIDNKNIDFRVSTLPSIFGEKVVLRVLDKTRGLMHLEELGMLPEILKKFRRIINHPYGIILVTGPTGSGKTTTLYSVLGEINSPGKNIITLEDPVEYTLEGVNQVQLNVKAGLTFASGLRSILRQDPDIIMVGEIRDAETAKIAIRSAMTGHLVFSTLHTNTAASTLTRLVDMGIEPFMVASSIVGIMAQRLVRRLCPECKEPYGPSQSLLTQLGLSQKGYDDKVFLYKPVGCTFCNNTGYRGRLAINEVLFMSSKIRDLINQKAPVDNIESTAMEEGMNTIKEDGLRKVVLGLTSLDEVMQAVFVRGL